MDHLIHASAAAGVRTDVPELFRGLLALAATGGHGADGIASTAQALSKELRSD